LADSPAFTSAPLTSEQVPFKTNLETTRNDLPIIHDTFRRKYDVKTFLVRFSYRPLLRQCHNTAPGCFINPHLALGAI